MIQLLVQDSLTRVVDSFQSRLMAKDLKLAMAAAQESGVKLVAGKLASQTYSGLEQTEFSTKDFSSVFAWLKQQSS